MKSSLMDAVLKSLGQKEIGEVRVLSIFETVQ